MKRHERTMGNMHWPVLIGLFIVGMGQGHAGAVYKSSLHATEKAAIVHPGKALEQGLGFVYAGVAEKETLLLQNKIVQEVTQGDNEKVVVMVPLAIHLTLTKGNPPFLVQFNSDQAHDPVIVAHVIAELKKDHYWVILIDEFQNAWVAPLKT